MLSMSSELALSGWSEDPRLPHYEAIEISLYRSLAALLQPEFTHK
jgi:hypothetical protein